jgi:pyruvate/2-oxoacid:ferredoxin oxidoreductase alpha subunit
MMSQEIIATGNSAAALAAKMAKVQVISAYPITPQTSIVETLSEWVERNDYPVRARFVRVESEHSALAVVIAASATGVRTFTATSSHGLALMHEVLHWAGGGRLPIVMAVVNRALGPPWSVWADHNDSLSQRNTGWIQFYADNNQEVFDTILQAYRVCEDSDVLLPAMVCLDAFILSHTVMHFSVPSQDAIDSFLPPYKPEHAYLDPNRPVGLYPMVFPESEPGFPGYMDFQYLRQKAMENARIKINEVDKKFEKLFGRSHGGMIQPYKCEDAEILILSMGTLASESTLVVDSLREQGYNAGSVKIRVFRPFPNEELRNLAKNKQAFVILDRNISFGNEGCLFTETKAALYNLKQRPELFGFIVGLGGRDVTQTQIEEIVKSAITATEMGEMAQTKWIGLR